MEPVKLSEELGIAIFVATIAFLAGGLIKGIAGVGLPMVALPILSFSYSVPSAVAMTMAPILVSNGWQILTSGSLRQVISRFWPMQLTLGATLLMSTSLMVRLPDSLLLISAGLMLIVSTLGMAMSTSLVVPKAHERIIGVGVGFVAGLVGGFSSLFGLPIIAYMMGLRLPRKEFVASIAVIYFCAATPFVAGLLLHGAVTPGLMLASLLSVIPVMIGLKISSHFMERVDESLFQKILYVFLSLLGAMMVFRGILSEQ